MSEGINIVLLGSAGVGAKTCLAHYLIHGEFEEHTDPTIEETYHTTLDVDGATFKLEILGLFPHAYFFWFVCLFDVVLLQILVVLKVHLQ